MYEKVLHTDTDNIIIKNKGTKVFDLETCCVFCLFLGSSKLN